MAPEIKIVGLLLLVAILVANIKPALVKSFEVMEQNIADEKMRIEIEKAKATQAHLRATGQIE